MITVIEDVTSLRVSESGRGLDNRGVSITNTGLCSYTNAAAAADSMIMITDQCCQSRDCCCQIT
jgi:hypothetical protein